MITLDYKQKPNMKRYIILALCLALGLTKTFSQESKLDSLLQLYQSQKDDTLKVNTLRKLFNKQLYIQSDKAKEYALEIISLSEKIGYDYGITMGNYCLGSYYFITRKMDSSSIYYRKSAELADTREELNLRANSLSGLANNESEKGNYRTAISLMDSAANIYLQTKYYLGHGIMLGDIGRNYINHGEYAKASNQIFKALAVLDTIDEEPFRKADLLRD